MMAVRIGETPRTRAGLRAATRSFVFAPFLLLALAPASPLHAQTRADGELQRRCWQQSTEERTAFDLREPVSVSFSNLHHGYSVRSPVWVEFGIRGMGVVPADNPHDKAGHHHILINRPLPTNHREKIPFDDSHRHFGRGQTGAALDLPPGRHTLRLLFADHEHRPHFVFSREITITVTGPRDGRSPRIDANDFDATCAAWYQDTLTTPRALPREVYLKNVRDGEQVTTPWRLSLGSVGYGIAPAGTAVNDTGHFGLTITQDGNTLARHLWRDGRTETVLDLPLGDVTLVPSLLGADGKPLLQGDAVRLRVVGRRAGW